VVGEFIWHQHADTDELFLILDGGSIWNFATVPSRSSPAGDCRAKGPTSSCAQASNC
jgi:hypothetical protein